jgi:hypothetical protein
LSRAVFCIENKENIKLFDVVRGNSWQFLEFFSDINQNKDEKNPGSFKKSGKNESF